MKVIDLLNKIANGEKTPDRFIYDGMLFERYLDNYYQYYDRKNTMSNIIQFSEEICSDYSNLNDEIEIPEDTPTEDRYINVCGSLFTKSEYDELAKSKEDKKIEKLNEYVDIGSFTNQIGIEDNLGFVHWSNDLKEGLDKQTNFNKNVLYKINEIIDKINGDSNE